MRKELDPWGGSTLTSKGIKGESSFFFTVFVFSYCTDVLFLYFKAL